MGFINLSDKTISAKLVYYGVGMGGKTTSLQAVHGVLCPRDEVQLVSINTEDDSTLLFDFLPIDLGQVEGFKIRIQGFTVPGQPKYTRMRRYVLQGADAVAFVVDSQSSRLQENIESLASMKENLLSNGLDPETMPVVLQYNKRDLDDILPESELDQHLKWREDVESFPTVAHEGHGVFEAFVHAAGELVESKVALYGLGRGTIDAAAVAEAVREKLWDAFDRNRRGGSVGEHGRVEVTVRSDDDRDPTGDAPPALFTDDELERPLDADVEPVTLGDGQRDPDADHLLDEVIRTNVELAEHFGDLDQYKSQLERKNRDLVEIAQNTVHDLNKPLSAIKLMLGSMRNGLFGEANDKMTAGIENGLLACRHMERLIGDLLDSSRLDHDGVKLKFGLLDMTLLVAETVRTLRYEIEAHDVICSIEPLPVILGDEWALSKAFMNLLGNAVQYCHPDRRPQINISVISEEDRHVFVIADNGIGIPEKDRHRMFKRFERGSNTSGVSGSGLGLHIVRETVLGHGGTVWVESVEGEGTKFMLALPHEPMMPPHSTVEGVELAEEELV